MIGYITECFRDFKSPTLRRQIILDLSRRTECNHKGSAVIIKGRGRQRKGKGQSKRMWQEPSPLWLTWEGATSQGMWNTSGTWKKETWKWFFSRASRKECTFDDPLSLIPRDWFQTSDFQVYRTIKPSWFKPLTLWQSLTVATGKWHTMPVVHSVTLLQSGVLLYWTGSVRLIGMVVPWPERREKKHNTKLV